MSVTELKKKDEFDNFKTDQLVVVHFYADWAEQCQHMNVVLEELATQKSLQDVKFVKCQAEEIPEVCVKYSVSAVPTFVLLRSGKLVDRVDGANPTELSKKVNIHASKTPAAEPAAAPAVDINSRLKSLIESAPVMLFMKGNPKEPRCGFSRQMIEILNSNNAEYQTFDILSDNDVREGLKKYSNWPTYPQLYVNGELVGGIDIVKEMVQSDELKSLLPKKQNLDERLKSLINKSNVMVFMKGNPKTPRCGFSRQLMEILNETGVAFETFDILEDEDVRQGLKTFSNWPTYPQIYVKGELIGGLDIIKELKESGELISSLK